jgi:urease accessory protein
MTSLPTAHSVRRLSPGETPDGIVVLTWDERLVRRRRLVSGTGLAFVVDLPALANVGPGEAFELTDGRLVAIEAAAEALLDVRGDLPRLAWHIGNRHAPCQIAGDRLLVRAGRVMEGMLRGLGATVTPVQAPFQPEGGAYGTGRTMGHSHGPGEDHDHGSGGARSDG